MLGYWNDPDATAASIDAARWMHTGDLAAMDGDGYVSIVGRIKDMVIRGGENVYPREVEEFLYTHPDVEDAQVIGVPSARYGEEVLAWVKPKAGAAMSAERLDAFCRGAIASYKIPRYWKLVDSFPLTVTGKVQKYRMRAISTAELGLGGARGRRERIADGRRRPGSPACAIVHLYLHLPRNLPAVLVHGAGYGIQGNRHIMAQDGTPFANLHMTLLDRLGLDVERVRGQ